MRRRKLLCPLALALVLSGCRTDTGPADPALAAFIPDEAIVLAGVRLEQIRTTPAGKQLAEAGSLYRFRPGAPQAAAREDHGA